MTEHALADVVDTAHLARYTMGDTKLENELLGMFAGQAEELCAALRQAHGGDDAEGWRLAAHTLKGAARAVGAFPMAAAAEALEEAGPRAREDLLERLERHVDDYLAAWRKWRGLHGFERRKAG